MQLGRVKVTAEYVVDLDNKEMVEQAKTALYEDIMNSVKFDELNMWIDTEKALPSELSEDDIPEFLIPKCSRCDADLNKDNLCQECSDKCSLCHEPINLETTHRHQGGWIGDKCCWDERLRSSE